MRRSKKRNYKKKISKKIRRQRIKGGNNSNVTVVSAYYPMNSKYPMDKYKEWIPNLYGNVGFNLVFFTNKEYTPFIEEIRKDYKNNTKIITLEFNELEALKKYDMNFWKEQNKKDPENCHIPELYIVWYEKKEFVKKAIEINPFNTEYFVWTDAGICRDKNAIPFLKNYPKVDKIPNDKIIINKLADFSDKNISFDFKHILINVGAGVIAGKIDSWKKFDLLYNDIFNMYIGDGRFCGKEQNLITTAILKDKNLFELFDGKNNTIDNYGYDSWVALLFYLA